MTGVYAAIFWLAVAVVFFVIESVTYQLVCIWFVVGAVGTTVVSFLDISFTAQLWVFLITSIVFLLVARPLLKDKIKVRTRPTNADRVIGMTGIVMEAVDNLSGTGRVNANGLSWTARSRDDTLRVSVGEKVRVLSIEGVKLIVEPIMDTVN